ncbi:MAG: hypothetical protein Q9164_005544 [Protoblastenia rupestris]
MQVPDLGSYVEAIDFEGRKTNEIRGISAALWAADETPGLAPDELESAVQWARQCQLASTDGALGEDLRRGEIDIYVCLVLSILPNLRSLALGSHFVTCLNGLLGRLPTLATTTSRKASGDDDLPTGPFASLQHVQLGRTGPNAVRSLLGSRSSDLIPFFYLPSLQDLVIELPRSHKHSWPTLSERPPMKNLTHLTLPYCKANESTLEQILASKPPLKKLVYDYMCDEDVSFDRGYYFNLPTFSQALSHIQATLESLTILLAHLAPDVDTYACYEQGFFNGCLAPLAGSQRLTYLEIPFLMLTGWNVVSRDTRPWAEMLPKSIQHLCLTDDLISWQDCDWEVRHWLERLEDLVVARVESKSLIAPDLQTVEVQRKSDIYEWETTEEEGFYSLGKRYGIITVFT